MGRRKNTSRKHILRNASAGRGQRRQSAAAAIVVVACRLHKNTMKFFWENDGDRRKSRRKPSDKNYQNRFVSNWEMCSVTKISYSQSRFIFKPQMRILQLPLPPHPPNDPKRYVVRHYGVVPLLYYRGLSHGWYRSHLHHRRRYRWLEGTTLYAFVLVHRF